MNWLDLVIIAVIAWTVFRAFSTGLITELVTLISLILGIVLAGAFYDDLSANLEFVIANPMTRHLVAFAAIFFGTMVAGAVVAAVLRTAAALLFLGPLDRLGGAVFGLVKGVLLVQIALAAIAVFPVQPALTAAMQGSTLAPVLLRYAPAIRIGLPKEFQDPLGQLAQQAAGAAVPVPGLPAVGPGAPRP